MLRILYQINISGGPNCTWLPFFVFCKSRPRNRWPLNVWVCGYKLMFLCPPFAEFLDPLLVKIQIVKVREEGPSSAHLYVYGKASEWSKGTHPISVQITFTFMQFSAKKKPNNRLKYSPLELVPPPPVSEILKLPLKTTANLFISGAAPAYYLDSKTYSLFCPPYTIRRIKFSLLFSLQNILGYRLPFCLWSQQKGG